MPIQPLTYWAQRKDALYVTVDVVDPEDVKVNIEEQSLSVTCKKDGNDYQITIPLYDKIDVSESKWAVKRNIICHLTKVEKKRWPTLLEKQKKLHNLKCDWNKWLDTDDEEEANRAGTGGFNTDDFDMSALGGMGGFGGMSGMDDGVGSDAESDDSDVLDGDEADEAGVKTTEADTGCCSAGDDCCNSTSECCKTGAGSKEGDCACKAKATDGTVQANAPVAETTV